MGRSQRPEEPLRVAPPALPGVGLQQPIPARLLLEVGAEFTAPHLRQQQLGGQAAPSAGQPRPLIHHPPARGMAGRARGGNASHQLEGEGSDRRHPGGVAMARMSVSTRASPSHEAAAALWIANCSSSQRCSPFSTARSCRSEVWGRTIIAWLGNPTCSSQRSRTASGPLNSCGATGRWAKLVLRASRCSRMVSPRC